MLNPKLEGVTFLGNVMFADDGVQAFTKRFQEKYKVKPDSMTIHGYEIIKTLDEALKHTNSTVPATLGAYFYKMKRENSLYGTIEFDQNGDMINPQVVVKTIRDGRIVEEVE